MIFFKPSIYILADVADLLGGSASPRLVYTVGCLTYTRLVLNSQKGPLSPQVRAYDPVFTTICKQVVGRARLFFAGGEWPCRSKGDSNLNEHERSFIIILGYLRFSKAPYEACIAQESTDNPRQAKIPSTTGHVYCQPVAPSNLTRPRPCSRLLKLACGIIWRCKERKRWVEKRDKILISFWFIFLIRLSPKAFDTLLSS